MSPFIKVSPRTLLWAIIRSGVDQEQLSNRFDKLDLWLQERSAPKLNELKKLASFLDTHVGMLVLPQPPQESMPLPDLRRPSAITSRPTANFLDTIYLYQRRQQWCRDHVSALDHVPRPRSWTTGMGVAAAVVELDKELSVRSIQRKNALLDVFRDLVDAVEGRGVMVMVNGVVGSNNLRPNEVSEFRSLILNDPIVPLLHINGKATKPAQVFCLLHSYVHLRLEDSGVDGVEVFHEGESERERWCNRVAAEVLIPAKSMKQDFDSGADPEHVLREFARQAKTTPLVAARQAYEANLVDAEAFHSLYRKFDREDDAMPPGGGGSYYLTQRARLGRRFARAVYRDTLAGSTLYREAYQLLGCKGHKTFSKLRGHIGDG